MASLRVLLIMTRLHAYLWLVVVCRVANLVLTLPTPLISTREAMTLELTLVRVSALPVNRLLLVCPVLNVPRSVMVPGLGLSNLTVLLSRGMLSMAKGEFPGCASAPTLCLLS